MGGRGARPALSRKRIHPAEFAPLQSASVLLDPARYRSRARQGERHESPNHRQRGADPTRGMDQHAFLRRTCSPRHAGEHLYQKLSLDPTKALGGFAAVAITCAVACAVLSASCLTRYTISAEDSGRYSNLPKGPCPQTRDAAAMCDN